jgi:hypothetical protein
VALEMVHRDERERERVGEALGRGDPDEERADEPGPHRDRDAAQVRKIGVGEGTLDHAVEAFEVGAGGDLRDDAAVALVLGLGVDDVREGAAPVGLDDGGAGVVAGGLYSQDHGVFIASGPPTLPRLGVCLHRLSQGQGEGEDREPCEGYDPERCPEADQLGQTPHRWPREQEPAVAYRDHHRAAALPGTRSPATDWVGGPSRRSPGRPPRTRRRCEDAEGRKQELQEPAHAQRRSALLLLSALQHVLLPSHGAYQPMLQENRPQPVHRCRRWRSLSFCYEGYAHTPRISGSVLSR